MQPETSKSLKEQAEKNQVRTLTAPKIKMQPASAFLAA